VANVDQGMEILTGMPAGKRDKDGLFPISSINGLVVAKLDRLAEKQRVYDTPLDKSNGASEEESCESTAS
jgi:hypothetical protein